MYVPYGYRDLLIQKESDGNLRTKVLCVLLNPEYLDKKIKVKPSVSSNIRSLADTEDFNGYLVQFELNGNLINGRYYENGVLLKELTPKSDQGNSNVKTELDCNSLKGPEKNICWVQSLRTVTIAPPPPPPAPAPAPAPAPTPNWVFPGAANGTGIPMPVGGGGGAGKGKLGLRNVTNDTKDPCIHQAVATLLNANLNNGGIPSIFNSMFGGNEEYNVTFDEAYYAKEDVAVERPLNSTNFTITFNTRLLVGASQETIVATMLHEMLHGIFDAKNLGNNSPTALTWNEAFHHQIMSSAYMDAATITLREIFPSLSKEDAYALTWEGLQTTLGWKALETSDPDKANDIKLRCANFDKDHKGGTRCQ